MRWVSSSGGVLRALESCPPQSGGSAGLKTGIAGLDDLLPGQVWRQGSVHEVIGDRPQPFLPLLVARRAALRGAIVWCDPAGRLYLPAVAAHGLAVDRLILLRPRSADEALWAINECLRCKGVAACVARIDTLSMLEARRLQLSAECGGGIGLLQRPTRALAQPYAAATRWTVRPTPGERTLHRWKVELIHGHGGRVGQSVILEVSRDTNLVRASETMADRSTTPTAATITA